MADFAPHNMTNNTAPSPYVASASSERFTAFRAFNGNGGSDNWLGCGSCLNNVAPQNMTGNSAPSPFVASASSSIASSPYYAFTFDGNASHWIGSGNGVDWLQIDLGSGNTFIVVSYAVSVWSTDESTRAPKTWTLKGSNDGAAFTVIDTVASSTGWSTGETRIFQCDDVSTAYRYFRIDITANNGDANYTQVAQLLLSTVSLTAAGGGVDLLQLDIGSGNSKILGSYDIQVNTIPEANRAPKDWVVQGSNDNSAWTTVDTVTGQTSWTSGQIRSFTCDTATTAYRYFRVYVTANNGDITYAQIAELFLYEAAPNLTPSVTDAITITESVNDFLTTLVPSVSDAITVIDIPLFTPGPPDELANVNDSIAVTESLTAITSISLSVSDYVVILAEIVSLGLTRTASGTKLIIAGVEYLFADNQPATISKRLSAAWSATFSIFYSSGSKPTPGQEVELFWASVKRFGGLVQSVAESRVKGPTNQTMLLVTCTGYQSYLTRAIVANLYTFAQSGWPIMIFDIWDQHLKQYGITLAYPQGPLTGFVQRLFHYITVAEAFNQCRDENAGIDYWITDNKELIFAAQGAGGAAPFTIRNADVNQDAVTVTRNNSKFRNKQWVLPSVSLTGLKVEPFTATAGQTVFEPHYPMAVKPIITLNGTAQAVTTLGNFDGSPWYYIAGSVGVFRSPGAPALSGGDAVVVTYPNPFPLGYSAQNDSSIAAVGLYESVYQAKDVADEATATALAQAILDTYGTSGNFPELLRFAYNSQSQAAWLLPGQVVDVLRTFPDATGNYVVEEVQSALDHLTVWRHTVTLRLGKGDVSESFERDFLAAARLWVNVPPTLATLELGMDNPPDTNPGLVVGLQPNTYRFRGSGIIASWDARFSANPPTGAALILDLLKNASTIFLAGNANKINIAAGATAEASGFQFVTANLTYADGDVLTCNVIQIGSTNPGKNGLVHLNLKPNAALPPA